MVTVSLLLVLSFVVVLLLENVDSKKHLHNGKHPINNHTVRKYTTSSDLKDKRDKRFKSKKRFVIPVSQESLSEKLAVGLSTLQDQVIEGAEEAVLLAKSVQRTLKRFFASDFEALLLQLTVPDDEAPDREALEKLITTTESFVRNYDLQVWIDCSITDHY